MANNMNNNQYAGWGGNNRNSSEYGAWPKQQNSGWGGGSGWGRDNNRSSMYNYNASGYGPREGSGFYSQDTSGYRKDSGTPNYFNSAPEQHVDAGRWANQLNRGNFDRVWNKARHVDDPSQHMTEGVTAGYSDFDKWKTHMQDAGWKGQRGGGSGEVMGGGGPDWVPRRLQAVHQYFANPGVGASMGWQNPINSRAGRDYAELAKEHNPDQWDARNRRAGMIQARHYPNPLIGGNSWS